MEPSTLKEMPRAKLVAFSLVLAAGVLGFAEAGFGIYYFRAIPREQREVIEVTLGLSDSNRNTVLRYRPHPYLNFVANPEYAYEDGTRPNHPIGIRATGVDLGKRRAGTVRIVALGGSTTYGHAFRDGRQAWPHITGEALSRALGTEVEVINAGVTYYTTFELVGMAAFWVPEFRPDFVVVHTGLNDAFSAGFPDEGGPDNTLFRYAWSYKPVPPLARTAMRLSYTARVLGLRGLSREGHMVRDMATAIQHPVPPLDQVRENASAATGKYFRRNLKTIVALIRNAGATPVLAKMALNPALESGVSPYHDEVSRAVLRNNRIMGEIAEQEGVTVVDLYGRLRDPALFLDAGHLGAAGQLLKAKAVAEALHPLVARNIATLSTPIASAGR